MHDDLGHRGGFVGRGGEIEIADDGIAVERQQMPGAVVRKLTQHLIADGGDAVGFPRRGDQLLDPALVLVGEGGAPGDRRH